jgi:hypothetical protein
VPRPIRERAQGDARLLVSESLRLARVLVELTGELERAGIAVLPFKGPCLALQAYGDLGARSFADLDLLVRLESLEAARLVLQRRGFAPSYAGTPGRRRVLVRYGSHETFARADGTVVELHWRLAAPVSEFGLDYDRLWGRLHRVEIAGCPVSALPLDDLLLVLALHGTKHAWDRLAWICDVAELLHRAADLDWDALLAETARMRCRRPLGLAVALAEELLEAPVPRALRDGLLPDTAIPSLVAHVRDRLFEPPHVGADTFAFHLKTRAGWGAKAGLALSSLTAINQRDIDLLPLPGPLLPLYFVTRPARLAGKAVAHALCSIAR